MTTRVEKLARKAWRECIVSAHQGRNPVNIRYAWGRKTASFGLGDSIHDIEPIEWFVVRAHLLGDHADDTVPGWHPGLVDDDEFDLEIPENEEQLVVLNQLAEREAGEPDRGITRPFCG